MPATGGEDAAVAPNAVIGEVSRSAPPVPATSGKEAAAAPNAVSADGSSSGPPAMATNREEAAAAVVGGGLSSGPPVPVTSGEEVVMPPDATGSRAAGASAGWTCVPSDKTAYWLERLRWGDEAALKECFLWPRVTTLAQED